MKFISIVGRIDYFEEFVCKYIINSGIQLENAMSKLENVKGLSAYTDNEVYDNLLKRSISLMDIMGIRKEAENKLVNYKPDFSCNSINTAGGISNTKTDMADNNNNTLPDRTLESKFPGTTLEKLNNDIEQLEKEIKEHMEFRNKNQAEINKYYHMQKQFELLKGLDVDLHEFFNFEYMKFRFGRIPKKSYRQLQLYIDDLNAVIHKVSQDQDYIWLIYFTPKTYSENVDGILSSLYFERIWLPKEFKGTPEEALVKLNEKLSVLNNQQNEVEEKIKRFVEENKEKVIKNHYIITELSRISEIRKYAAHTRESFYITGWLPEDELNILKYKLDNDKKILYIIEDPENIKDLKPPILLKNNRLVKPFETLVKMYGLPSYNEIDPTTFVAVTYFIMFGIMFGDVGQGLILFAVGLILAILKISIGGVIVGAGIASTIFGFLYGSIFGFETWIPALWLRPMENINTILVFGIGTGVLLITCAMILNILNGIKSRNITRVLLDRNGIAGFLFYWIILSSVLYYLINNKLPFSFGIMLMILLIPLLVMFFKEPIENMYHKKEFLPKEKGVFFIQTFFEMFDTVLSYLSNTISFIRLAAFTLNHAGLFMAFMTLAEMTKGFGGILEIIFGNILIIGLEGLIVGIQALRLEYYELFNRFFTGNGRPYKPIDNNLFNEKG